MRQKYRVWNKTKNEYDFKYRSVYLLNYDGKVLEAGYFGGEKYKIDEPEDEVIIEHFIGKQDKNKVDAYEGDIIKYKYVDLWDVFPMCMRNELPIEKEIIGEIYWCQPDCAFYVNDKENEQIYSFSDIGSNFEVVGNIHQGLYDEMLINQVGKEEAEAIDKDTLRIIKEFNEGIKE